MATTIMANLDVHVVKAVVGALEATAKAEFHFLIDVEEVEVAAIASNYASQCYYACQCYYSCLQCCYEPQYD
jgi:hypothetical protein